MANEKIGIDFYATTAAAVAEIDKLSEATKAAADAADAAGKGQKGLGREVKEARAAQIEATEATRRANDAQRIHALTVQKLGANSKEAKASALALNAAQAESKRAATAAAEALQKTAKAVMAAAQAEDGNLSPATKRAAAQLERMGKDAERTARELKLLDLQTTAAAVGATKFGKSLSAMSVAGGMLVANGVGRAVDGIGSALKGSVTSAIDFETKMTGIGKVLDNQSPENLARVDEQIKEMAVSLGVLPTELAAMTQALAASGLQSDLAGYTADAAKLGVAFDLTGQEAGHAIASLTASLGLSRTEMQSLMGTVNELDDGMNSSSKQLVEYLESVAGIGRSASISGETMLALGSAIISTGTAPDKAATGVKNFIATMEAGTAATDVQVSAFAKLGLSATDVAKEMASGNAEAQIQKISAALAGLPNEERFATMIDLFSRESIGSVGGLATNVNLLGDAFKIAGDKAAAAGSVQAEFDRVSKTTAANVAQLKANVSVTAIEIGAALLPQVNSIAKEVSAWVSQNRELLKANVAGGIAKITEVAKDLWPVLKTLASTVSSVTSAVGAGNVAYIAMAGKLVGMTSDVGGLAVKMATTLIPSLAGVGTKLAALAGPAGLFALGAAGVAALSYAALQALYPVENAADAMARKVHAVHQQLQEMRLKEMRAQATQLGASNAALTKENERRTKILEAGYTNEGMAESAAAAGMEARRKALHGRRISQLNDEERDLVKASIQRAMVNEKLAYMERADRAGSGTVAPTAITTDKEKKAGARAGAVAAKKEAKFADDSRDFNVEMQVYAAEENKRVREESIASQQKAFEAEAAIFERKDAQFERELELLEARGGAEEDAQKAREALQDRRLNAEQEFARAQLRMAKTDAQREQATTRMENVEYQKRLVSLRRMAAAEQAEHARKVAITEKVTARVSDLGTAMVDAAWEAAEGQRGAGLQALGDYLKTVSKQMAIKALVETALGAAALAGVVTAGLAPGHFAAAGIAAGVAVAAGGAGVAFSAAGDARAASGQGRPESANDSGATPSGAANGPPSSNSQPKRELDAQEVPISYGSAARPMPVQTGDTININLAGATFIGSKGPEDAAQQIQKMLRQGKAAGER